MASINELKKKQYTWNSIPYNKQGGGCGAAMRAMCIGLRFVGENQRDKLIAVSIESGRITHNHPSRFFGALCAAVFTAFAIERVPLVTWGKKLLDEILPKAYEYLRESKRDWENYQKDLKYFENKWNDYLKLREIRNPTPETMPKFPENYGVQERDTFYSSVSYNGWGGSSGHDSVLIAYDALLGAVGNWNELVLRGVLHGGDNDSTGAIACAWFGAKYGFKTVPKENYDQLEYAQWAEELAEKLLLIASEKVEPGQVLIVPKFRNSTNFMRTIITIQAEFENIQQNFSIVFNESKIWTETNLPQDARQKVKTMRQQHEFLMKKLEILDNLPGAEEEAKLKRKQLVSAILKTLDDMDIVFKLERNNFKSTTEQREVIDVIDTNAENENITKQ